MRTHRKLWIDIADTLCVVQNPDNPAQHLPLKNLARHLEIMPADDRVYLLEEACFCRYGRLPFKGK
jgi:hypothetical protein